MVFMVSTFVTIVWISVIVSDSTWHNENTSNFWQTVVRQSREQDMESADSILQQRHPLFNRSAHNANSMQWQLMLMTVVESAMFISCPSAAIWILTWAWPGCCWLSCSWPVITHCCTAMTWLTSHVACIPQPQHQPLPRVPFPAGAVRVYVLCGRIVWTGCMRFGAE